MEYDGIKFYFIDNEYYFSGPKPYDSAPVGSGEICILLQGSAFRTSGN